MKSYHIAFVGNPNVGKSAWINALSDADFQIGNWPGVTVEKKEALCIWDQSTFHLIDLPGCYSLSKQSNEERITSEYLRNEHIDVIVNVVDATNLSQNLLLTLYLRELQIPMILLFNFMDAAEKLQMRFEFQKLSRRLQLPILPYSAFDKDHIKDVQTAIQSQINKSIFYYPLYTNEDVEHYVQLFNLIEQHVPHEMDICEQDLHRICTRVMYREEEALHQCAAWHISLERIQECLADITPELLEQHRYQTIDALMNYVHRTPEGRYHISQKIDRIMLHPYLGMPLFFLLFTILLLFVFQVSSPWNDVIASIIHILSRQVEQFLLPWAPNVLIHLLVDGVIAGVGGVLTFIPLMTLLYMMLSLLEESGYMARIAFLLDRIMHNVHLSGKSFVSFMLGFGCNVPAIYATRTLDNEKQKKITALLIPFMSCGARMPVYVLFASAFFPNKAGMMIITIYAMGILIAILLAFLYSRLHIFQEDQIFILELPPYHLPRFHVIWHKVVLEVRSYIKKATGVVLWAMIILWSLSYFPTGDLQNSYLAFLSQSIAPIYEPLGFGNRWEAVASLPGGIVAKETIIGFYEQILQPSSIVETPNTFVEDMKNLGKTIGQAIQDSVMFIRPNVAVTPASDDQVKGIASLWTDRLASLRAFCFMIYVLLSIPCIMTLQALYHEYGWKLTAISIASMVVIPYGICFVIFQFFSRIL